MSCSECDALSSLRSTTECATPAERSRDRTTSTHAASIAPRHSPATATARAVSGSAFRFRDRPRVVQIARNRIAHLPHGHRRSFPPRHREHGRGQLQLPQRGRQPVIMREDDDLPRPGNRRQHPRQPVNLGRVHRLHRVVDDHDPNGESAAVARGRNSASPSACNSPWLMTESAAPGTPSMVTSSVTLRCGPAPANADRPELHIALLPQRLPDLRRSLRERREPIVPHSPPKLPQQIKSLSKIGIPNGRGLTLLRHLAPGREVGRRSAARPRPFPQHPAGSGTHRRHLVRHHPERVDDRGRVRRRLSVSRCGCVGRRRGVGECRCVSQCHERGPRLPRRRRIAVSTKADVSTKPCGVTRIRATKTSVTTKLRVTTKARVTTKLGGQCSGHASVRRELTQRAPGGVISSRASSAALARALRSAIDAVADAAQASSSTRPPQTGQGSSACDL